MHWMSDPDRLYDLITTPRAAIISDFDGTLSPFTPYPDQARMLPENAAALDNLAGLVNVVALVSGRGAADLYERYPRRDVVYYGNHGMEIWKDGDTQIADAARSWYAPLQELLQTLGKPSVPGVTVENKRVTASIHYRLSPNPAAARQALYDLLLPLCADYGFRLSEGRYIWEIKPPIALNKGTAVEEIVNRYRLKSVLFLGDDITDFTAMRRLRELHEERGLKTLSVGVVHSTTVPELYEQCDLTANGVEDVSRLLNSLAVLEK